MNAALLWSVVPYLVALLFPMVVACSAFLYMSLVQRLPMQQRLIVSSMAHTVVRAVEQMMPTDTPSAQKKDQALHALVTILEGVGIKVPAPLLETALEAAVFELHTLYPHTSSEASEGLTGPFPYRQTIRSLPAVQLGVSPTAPTAPISLVSDTTKSTDARPS